MITDYKFGQVTVNNKCYGVMKMNGSLKKYCILNNINMSEFTKGEAVKYYTNLKTKTALAIHLTC